MPTDIYVARQPVFTARKKLFGYELLFRQGFENSFPDIDGDTATSQVLSNTFFSFQLNEILGDHPGLINFTRELLVKKTPLLFPKEHFIIEVLEDIAPDDEIMGALSEFKSRGYRIALDDFAYQKQYDGMIRLSDMIKFDLLATPLDTLEPLLASPAISGSRVTLLAEKVETYEAFEKAKAMGFTLFQGYFFSRPEILTRKTIPDNQVTRLNLMGEINKSDVDMNRIEAMIKADVSISFKLLKFINSAYFKRTNPINTIRDAVMYLGVDELKKFITVVVVSDLNPAKPNELIRTSILRARLCELCGSHFTTGFTTDELFTIGLFSAMDAIMDMAMADILTTIDLSASLKDALLGRDRAFQKLFNLVKGLERGRWDLKEFKLLENTRLMDRLPGFYQDAVKLSDAFFRQV